MRQPILLKGPWKDDPRFCSCVFKVEDEVRPTWESMTRLSITY